MDDDAIARLFEDPFGYGVAQEASSDTFVEATSLGDLTESDFSVKGYDGGDVVPSYGLQANEVVMLGLL